MNSIDRSNIIYYMRKFGYSESSIERAVRPAKNHIDTLWLKTLYTELSEALYRSVEENEMMIKSAKQND